MCNIEVSKVETFIKWNFCSAQLKRNYNNIKVDLCASSARATLKPGLNQPGLKL